MKKRNYYLLFGAILTAAVLAFILLGYFWTPCDPMKMDGAARSAAPSLRHLMGTDKFGRDILSRVMKGAGATFLVAFGTVVIGTVIGTLVGALTGYFGGWLDEVLMRFNDALSAFPASCWRWCSSACLAPAAGTCCWRWASCSSRATRASCARSSSARACRTTSSRRG